MTREVALRKVKGYLTDYFSIKDYNEIEEIMLALEQQPCEDCISRKDAINLVHDLAQPCDNSYDWDISADDMIDGIKELPSVTPQPKIGKWIMKHRTHNKIKHYTGQDEMGETHTISVLERYEVDEPYCSECGKLAGDTSQDYCCACGAKMEVE